MGPLQKRAEADWAVAKPYLEERVRRAAEDHAAAKVEYQRACIDWEVKIKAARRRDQQSNDLT